MSATAVVPVPAELQELGGDPFVLGAGTVLVVASAEARPAADRLAELLVRSGLQVQVGDDERAGHGERSGHDEDAGQDEELRAIRLRLGPSDAVPQASDEAAHAVAGRSGAARMSGGADEAYVIEVRADGVELRARTPAGLGHAVTTLSQLVVRDEAGTAVLPPVRIVDTPRFAWRGLSVDTARHFVSVPDLLVITDLMADYKLNVLHLHLTDDQAWRLDLPSRPELVARSSGASVDGDAGGHYSADDYARLVAHAAARGIVVVPEVDVPGHVNAALHAYGELTPSGQPTEEYLGIEVGFSRLTAALPATGAFLHDVFTDVAAMTPGPYVHIGGDEVLGMASDEYTALVAAAAEAVRAAGKQVVGWQEIAGTPLQPGTVVQYWDVHADPAPFVAAGAAGALLLLSPGSRTYLDMKYHPGYPLGLEWAGHVEVRDSYDWEPTTLLPGLPAEALIGVEAAVWTETLRTLDDLTTMLLPRLAAVAEVAWSRPERRDWEDFRGRVASHGARWDAAGLRWYASPQVAWRR